MRSVFDGMVSGTLQEMRDPQHEDLLRMRPLRAPPKPDATILATDFHGALLSLSATDDFTTMSYGTAFLVAPGIALTAKHILDDYASRGRPLESIVAVGARGGELMPWTVTASLTTSSDAAVLLLAPRFSISSDKEIVYFKPSTRLPLPGELVGSAGYPGIAEQHPNGAEGQHEIAIDPLYSCATVGEFYQARGTHLPSPGFVCGLTAPGGMSGSPVFGPDGHVVGLVSSSMDHGDGWSTFATLLWPALLIPCDPVWPKNFHPSAARIIDFDVDSAWRLHGVVPGDYRYLLDDVPLEMELALRGRVKTLYGATVGEALNGSPAV